MGFPTLAITVPTNIGRGAFYMKHAGALYPNSPAGGNNTEAGRTIDVVTSRLLIIGFGAISLALTTGWYLVLFQLASWAMGRGHP